MTVANMAAKARRVGDTSIRVDPDAKALLDRARQEMGQQHLTYAEFLENLARQALSGRDDLPATGTFDVDISEELQPVLDRLDRLENQLRGVAGINALMVDPQNGLLFDAMSAPHGNGANGVEGDTIQMPENGERWAEEVASRSSLLDGFLGSSSTPAAKPAGWWVRTPSGVYLTERDKTLPESIEDLYEAEAKRARKGKKEQ